jgi:hypothetical protein
MRQILKSGSKGERAILTPAISSEILSSICDFEFACKEKYGYYVEFSGFSLELFI